MELKYEKSLRFFLWAVALHSFLVGLGLIFVTNHIRVLFGFKPSPEHFFQIQGGVFHIVMAMGYILAADKRKRFDDLIVFTIIVKLFATIFLLLYFAFGSQNWLILFSGLTDFLMCVIVFYLYSKSRKVKFPFGE